MFVVARVVLHRGRWQPAPWPSDVAAFEIEDLDDRSQCANAGHLYRLRGDNIAEIVKAFDTQEGAEFHLRKLELVEPDREFRVCRTGAAKPQAQAEASAR
jgi:hypothetical protein